MNPRSLNHLRRFEAVETAPLTARSRPNPATDRPITTQTRPLWWWVRRGRWQRTRHAPFAGTGGVCFGGVWGQRSYLFPALRRTRVKTIPRRLLIAHLPANPRVGL